ncbi:forkhead-associated domain-containing protein 1 [Chanos chanos]|uniref:Forkhead-associated domain-containing protein 1 n=1 Tax=Chanos chanos TaxID=29144 RepID=A0A6J2WCK8_CHACN|nr:forkhead-associated domain-containing protein 1-like [Chanos chanos]
MRGYLKTQSWVFKLQPKSTTVGRNKDSDLCLQNGGVDDRHAVIEWSESERCYIISDLNTAHGTYVNDCRIHNATVRLTPGDELHFGYGGSTYEFALDSTSPLPVLRAQCLAPPTRAWADPSVTPHPPKQTRPASAGAKRSSQALGSSTLGSHSNRPGSWTGNTGRGQSLRNVLSSQSSQYTQHSIQEKEENLLRMRDDARRLVVLEDECKRKDRMITALQQEVSALRDQLTQNQTDPETRQRLHSLEREINDKKEQIQELREQMLELQRGSAELFQQAVKERDQKISSLRGQVEKLRGESSKASGMVNSLQSDLTAREKQALKLAAEVDKLRQNLRQKDLQFTAMANKFSKMKENQKLEEEILEKEREVISLKKDVEKLELTVKDRERELKEQKTEKNSLRQSLEQKREEQVSLQTEIQTLQQQHQLIVQRDKKNEEELKQTQTRLKCLFNEIMRSTDITADAVSDQQVMDQLTELMKQLQMFRSRAQEMEETHTVSILTTLLELLQDITHELQDSGIQVSQSTGVIGAIKALCQQHEECQAELRDLRVAPHSPALTVTRRDLTVTFQAAESQRGEVTRLTKQLEEVTSELQSVRRTETALREERETQERAWISKLKALERQGTELNEGIEEGKQREDELRERLREAEEREAGWRIRAEEARQRGAEEERERYRVEEAEYREQVRQHAHTIVALEERLSAINQSLREVETERDSLREQLRESQSKLETDKSSTATLTSAEQQQLDQNIRLLRSSLAASQQEAVTQGEVITALSRDLAHAHARISDMKGELNEEQKLELERHRALLVDQKMQLSTLTQKLNTMSQLVEQKDEELKNTKQKMKRKETAENERRELQKNQTEDQTSMVPLQSPVHTKDVAILTAFSDLSEQGSKCKGHRHEEVIHSQQEALSEMRERMRALKQKWPIKLVAQQGEPERQRQMKPPKIQRSTTQRGSITHTSGFALPEALSEAALERTARLDMSDTLDLSENTYAELVQALCEALELSEGQLSGCASLKHLPAGERERLASLRQRDLEFLRTRLALQRSQSQRKELQLQESQRELQTLRESQAQSQSLQARLDSLKAELQTQRQESSLLREALEQTHSQLEQERGLRFRNQQRGCALRSRQAASVERLERRSGKVTPHNCALSETSEKARGRRLSLEEKLRRRDYEVEILKKQLCQTEQELRTVASQLAQQKRLEQETQKQKEPKHKQSVELIEAQ